MGSGLIKCSISNQIINEDEHIVLFPIFPTNDGELIDISKNTQNITLRTPNSSTVYSSCLFSLQGVHFTATMDDYASAKISDTLHNKYSFYCLIKFLIEESYITKQGKNEYHEMSFDIHEVLKFNKINDLFNDLFNDNIEIFMKNINHEVMVKVIQYLMEYGDKNRIYVDNHIMEPSPLKFSIVLKTAFDHAVKKTKTFKKIEDDIIGRIGVDYSKINEKENELIRIFERYISDSYNHSYTAIISYIFQQNLTQSKKDPIDNLIKKLKFIIDFIKYQRYLNINQLLILPITGYAQDYANDSGKAYKELVNEVNKKIKQND